MISLLPIQNSQVKNVKISTQSPLPLQAMKKMDAMEMRYIDELRATFKNNIDRVKVDCEEKLAKEVAKLHAKLRQARIMKYCPICQKEVTVDVGFDPSACSRGCWKKLL